jgi:hypothetical protein
LPYLKSTEFQAKFSDSEFNNEDIYTPASHTWIIAAALKA